MDSIRFEERGIKVEVTEAAVREYVRRQLGGLDAHSSGIKLPPIGAVWAEQGGVFGGFVKGCDGRPVPIIVPEDIKASLISSIEWGSRGKEEPGARDDWDGPANTLALVNSKHRHPAAEKAAEASIGGYKDWYLMARREAPVLYANLPHLLGELGWCWTSTESSNPECSALTAWAQHFGGGYQFIFGKDNESTVFPVRRASLSDLVIL